MDARLVEIRVSSFVLDWRCCPTNLNPADVGTRKISPKYSRKFLPWLNGPAFLSLPENKWPVIPFEKDQIVDVTSLFMSSNEVKPEIDSSRLDPSSKFLTLINYYSDFQRLIG